MSMRIVETPDGAQLATQRQGAGQTVLLVSGLGGTAGFWTPLIARQISQWDMLSLDQRGIGQSTRGQASVTIRQLADDCLHVLDAHGVESCVMIGHSTGGVITQDLAARYPHRIKAIVLSGSWLEPHHYLDALFTHRLALLDTQPDAYQAFGALMGYAPDWLCTHWSVFQQLMKNTPCTVEAIQIIRERIKALLAFEGRAKAQELQMSALVLGARDDAIVPFPLQEILQHALPKARLSALDSGGHFFPLTRLEETLRVITEFMSALDG